MKRLSTSGATRAFTLLEVLVILAIICLLVAMVVPMMSKPDRDPGAYCMSNLKQIGMGLWIWAEDHDHRLPMQVAGTNGGSMEWVSQGGPARHFQALSGQLTRQFAGWTCPTDKTRKGPAGYAAFEDKNASYFLNVDADLTRTNLQHLLLAGDRHLAVAGESVKPGMFMLTTNLPIGWTQELHPNLAGSGVGSLLFCDGHVEFVRNHRMAEATGHQPSVTNRLAVP